MIARPRGFSLIELMAVLVIVGVLLLAVVPSIDGLVPKYRLRSGARSVAATIEHAQSTAVSRRQEFAVAYDLDENTYWMILPPEEEEDPAAEEDQGGGLFGLGGDEEGKQRARPLDDIEHGPPPPDPDAEPTVQEETPDMVDREALEPTRLPRGVVFERVVVGDDEKTNGRVYVTFSHLGNQGSHVVGVRLQESEDTQVWIKFNALSRTLEYSPEQPEVRRLQSQTAEAGGAPQ